MRTDLKTFWLRFQTGIEVAVAGSTPDELLGVREGLLRYVQRGLGSPVPVAVVPHARTLRATGLPLSDEATLERAQDAAAELQASLGEAYHFYVASEGGLHEVQVGNDSHWFIRSWTVVRSVAGEAWGSSGSIEIPQRLLRGMPRDEIAWAVPGTRRRGGLISSLTGGLESRRSATATSTFHALSSLFYGVLERGAGVRRAF